MTSAQASLFAGEAGPRLGKRPASIIRESVGDLRFRSTLVRRWAPGPLVAWLMCNPSTADDLRDDPTSWRVIEFTHAWGYPGAIIVNFAPFRSSKPAELWPWLNWQDNGPDWQARDAWQANLGTVEKAARGAALRVVAFGAEIVRRQPVMLDTVLEAFGQPSDVDADERLHCLATNDEGSPRHPLARGKWRVPDGAKPQPWQGFAAGLVHPLLEGATP
ncbi:DUF1643 domain-containing protein [Azospirillum brasilense]|uniref:DUF1643 domain-containing protein n=1 Tax=Azospirillum brasilense TaxID=192 RepID=UPI0022AB1DC6|nr:DUF1643 domain-containing protein [Azospirillum brasilense]UKJ74535.1 DUF1643 domain-containing protein [Azospirillum brasilense]